MRPCNRLILGSLGSDYPSLGYGVASNAVDPAGQIELLSTCRQPVRGKVNFSIADDADSEPVAYGLRGPEPRDGHNLNAFGVA